MVLGDSVINGSGNSGYGVCEYLSDKFVFKLHKLCYSNPDAGGYEEKYMPVIEAHIKN